MRLLSKHITYSKSLCVLVFLLSMITSCKDQVEMRNNENLIPRELLIKVLIDLEIMEAYYEQVHKRPPIYKTTLDSASRQILIEYDITEKQLKNTLTFYSESPDSLYALYEQTLDSINSMVIKSKNQTD